MKDISEIVNIIKKCKKYKNCPYTHSNINPELCEVYKKLMKEVEDHKKTLKLLEERLKFEELISRLSARFVNITVNEIDSAINTALCDIVNLLGLHRSYIYEFIKEENIFKQNYGYNCDGIPPQPSYVNETYVPWVARQMEARKIVNVTGINDIPEEEVIDRDFYLKFCLKKELNIPMSVEGELAGCFILAVDKDDFSWSEPLLAQLILLGQILSSAIARKRNEEKNRILREELYQITRCITMDELSASLTHEINQPLCSIMADAETGLRLVPPDNKLHHILEDIVSASKRANSVITSYSRMFKKEKQEFSLLNMNELIKDSLSMLYSNMSARQIEIEMKSFTEVPDIMGDRIKLQQVIINLILNGADSMTGLPEESRKILTGVEMADKDNIKVYVMDRGHGLKEKEKIFLPFYTNKSEGMGIGLYIAKSIIEEHNGTLWAENNHDRGSTFYFTIPVTKKTVEGPFVYIIDDDPMVIKSMVRMLETEGYRFKSFASPEEFFKVEHYEEKSCLILDVTMPSMTGLELQKKMKKIGITIPVIFISGQNDVAASVTAMKNGAVDFLCKPFKKMDILDAIHRAMEENIKSGKEKVNTAIIEEKIKKLTVREREILPLVTAGILNKNISARLGISESTVKMHRKNIMKKLEVKSLAALIRIFEQTK